MRIITGKLKGRNIPIPDTGLLRPTSDRTKEGIFSVIDARIYLENTIVLDLFAGSGNLGFEALSRGSGHCTFVDSERKHIDHIKNLATEFDMSSLIRTEVADVADFVSRNSQSYDLVFADPPYDYPGMEDLIENVMQGDFLKEEGWFILEHDKRHNFTNHPYSVFNKPYGRTIVSIFVLPGTEF